MTSTVRVLVSVGVCILIAGGAGAAGFYPGAKAQRDAMGISDFIISAHQSAVVNLERTSGTAADYEAALRSYITLLDELEGHRPPDLDPRTYSMERARTLIRLSQLAEKRGEKEKATQLAATASIACAKNSSRDCSVSTLTALTKRLDEHAF